jgi:hypothetical protein
LTRTVRLQALFIFIGIVWGLSPAAADTVVDVSREWKAHASTAPVSAHPSTASSNAAVTVSTPSAPEPTDCGCESLTTPEKLEQATYAFTGMVLEAGSPKKGRRTIVFDTDEIFKGSPKQEMEIVEDISGTDCDFSFENGQNYLVYARWEWGSAVTSRCMGTKLLEKANAKALGPSEEMKDKLYLHLRDACMGRLDTSCCLESLKAMRADYHVPEPEEGCPSGMVPDRLSCAGSYTWCISFTEKSHRMPDH